MSYQQHIVNAQVSVNRAVFEINRKGSKRAYPKAINTEYLGRCIDDAIKDLTEARKKLKNELPFDYLAR